MKLKSEGRRAIEDAQASDVYAAVSELALPGHSFLILTRTNASFVQLAIQPGERFIIEYREGDAPVLRAAREDFSRGDVAQLFASYLAGGDAWREGIQWQPIGGRPRDRWDTVGRICAIAAVVTLVVLVDALLPSRRRTSRPDLMAYLSIATLVYLPSVLIAMRRFKQMDGWQKRNTILALFFALLAIAYWIDRWVSHGS
jgi:hypothetical protein